MRRRSSVTAVLAGMVAATVSPLFATDLLGEAAIVMLLVAPGSAAVLGGVAGALLRSVNRDGWVECGDWFWRADRYLEAGWCMTQTSFWGSSPAYWFDALIDHIVPTFSRSVARSVQGGAS